VKNYGLQVGMYNQSAFQDWGMQTGVYNQKGMIQLGLFNIHGRFQLGLLNYNPKSYIPWLPFVNWDMGREEK
jgi:hypothetical protein